MSKMSSIADCQAFRSSYVLLMPAPGSPKTRPAKPLRTVITARPLGCELNLEPRASSPEPGSSLLSWTPLFAIAGRLFLIMSETNPTARTRVVREPQRAVYDRAVAYEILDEAFICHVGFVVDGQPFVIPTGFGRAGDNLYIHGSAASRMLRNLDGGVPMCVTVTLLDGLVLARSIFNHSMNYRSVVVLGVAQAVTDRAEKLQALRSLSEHILPGRWAESRQPNEQELKATLVMRLPIEEFSAKVRSGPPMDDEQDYAFPTWAGVIPLEIVAGEAVNDPSLDPGVATPEYVRGYSRKNR